MGPDLGALAGDLIVLVLLGPPPHINTASAVVDHVVGGEGLALHGEDSADYDDLQQASTSNMPTLSDREQEVANSAKEFEKRPGVDLIDFAAVDFDGVVLGPRVVDLLDREWEDGLLASGTLCGSAR